MSFRKEGELGMLSRYRTACLPVLCNEGTFSAIRVEVRDHTMFLGRDEQSEDAPYTYSLLPWCSPAVKAVAFSSHLFVLSAGTRRVCLRAASRALRNEWVIGLRHAIHGAETTARAMFSARSAEEAQESQNVHILELQVSKLQDDVHARSAEEAQRSQNVHNLELQVSKLQDDVQNILSEQLEASATTLQQEGIKRSRARRVQFLSVGSNGSAGSSGLEIKNGVEGERKNVGLAALPYQDQADASLAIVDSIPNSESPPILCVREDVDAGLSTSASRTDHDTDDPAAVRLSNDATCASKPTKHPFPTPSSPRAELTSSFPSTFSSLPSLSDSPPSSPATKPKPSFPASSSPRADLARSFPSTFSSLPSLS
eukprot:3522361-Rhodomonas_salina.1